VISPLLANIYLHYLLDLWPERLLRREATGDMIIVRYADDFIVGFQREADARRFWDGLIFASTLTLHQFPNMTAPKTGRGGSLCGALAGFETHASYHEPDP
jgi:hypothetical protein